MNLLIYSLDAIAALCALGGVAMLVFLPIALLGDFSVGLAIAVGALIFGVAAVSVFRYGNSERATWWVRLSAPVGLGLLIWIGGFYLLGPRADDGSGWGGRDLVTWAMLDAVPLLDLDRMLDFESPLDEWSADVGLVLVLIRLAVLALLVGLAADVWRWAHGSVQEHGLGVIAREAVVRLVGRFDGRLTWRRWAIVLGALAAASLAWYGMLVISVELLDPGQ